MVYLGVVLAHLLVLSLGQGAWAAPDPPMDKTAETASSNPEETQVEPLPPPIEVAGTAVSGPTKAAFLALLDSKGREVGILKVSEGESIEGYRVVEIQTDQVSFERDGKTFVVPVQHKRPPAPGAVPDLSRQTVPTATEPPEPSAEEKEKLRSLLQDTLQRQANEDEGFRKVLLEGIKRRLDNKGREDQ